jgi:hypothetical protein
MTPLAHIRWFLTLARKLLRVTPGMTMLVVAATLAAQMASILAFFLPLKVLILLGSPGVPRYFPAVMADMDRNLLIVLLASAAGAFYLLHLLCERIIGIASIRGAGLLEAQSGKLQLFDDQQNVLLEAYRLFSRAASSMVFIGLALLLLAWLYPLIAGWFLLALLGGWVFGWIANRLPWLGRRLLGDQLLQSISVWSSVGFLGGFACLVVNFSLGASQGLLAALIALLLSRQMFRHAEVALKCLLKLDERRGQYEALFIHQRPMLIAARVRQKDRHLWRHMLPENRLQWLVGLGGDFSQLPDDSTDFRWHDSGTAGVSILQLSPGLEEDGEKQGRALILYEKSREGMARKEAELLEAMRSVPEFPAAPLVRRQPLDDGRLHVFALPSGSHVPSLREGVRVIRQLRCQLLKSTPPAPLVERYRRSHSMLPARLDDGLLERLQLACHGTDEERLLNELAEHLGGLRKRLKSMPLAVMLTTRQPGPVMQSSDGQCILLRWEHWALEPAGAGWPFAEHEVKRYAAYLEEARQFRADLASVEVQDIYLAAVTYALEKACQRQAYRQALQLVPIVLGVLAGHGKQEAS